MQLVFGLLLTLVVLFTLLGTLLWAPGDKNGGYLIGGSGDQTVIYSEDGVNWTAGVDVNGNIPFGSSGAMLYMNYAGGLWVAVGDPNTTNGESMVWSSDGKTWNYGTGEKFGTSASSFGEVVVYADGIWVAGGTSENTLLWSYDGKEWNNADNDPFNTGSCNGLFNATGLWLAGGRDGDTGTKIWWSENGKSWTATTGAPFGTGVNNSPGRFAYGNGRYVNCGDDQVDSSKLLWYSDDGKAWSEAIHPFTSAVGQDVVYANDIFVASTTYGDSSNPMIAYSTDGNTFIAATVPGTFTAASNFNKLVVRENGFWLALGTNGSNGIIYKSEDGRTWEDVTPDSFFPGADSLVRTGIWGKVNGKWRVVISGQSTNGENIWWSEDGENWTVSLDSPFGSDENGIGDEARWSGLAV